MDCRQVGGRGGRGVCLRGSSPAAEQSRVPAGWRAAAAGERLLVGIDVLEAPSMGRKRNGTLTVAQIRLLGRGAESEGSPPWGCGGREPRPVVSGLFCFLGCHTLV